MKVDTSEVKIPVEDDSYFAREEQPKKTAEDDFFEQGSKGPVVSDKRKADQKTVDSEIMAKMSDETLLKEYLRATFSLKKGDRPHEMLF